MGLESPSEKAGKKCNRPKTVRPVFFAPHPVTPLASPQRSRASPFLDDERQSHGHSPARLRREPSDSLGGATAYAGIAALETERATKDPREKAKGAAKQQL